jgi:hypothetical protein
MSLRRIQDRLFVSVKDETSAPFELSGMSRQMSWSWETAR